MADAEIKLIDTVTKLDDSHRDAVLIGASHGGVYAAYCAAKAGVRAVILNDASVGKDAAGIGGLAYLQDLGLPAATVDAGTGRIADAADMAEHGRISHVNAAAAALGGAAGQATMACAEAMRHAPVWQGTAPAYDEARFVLQAAPDAPRVIGCDSASLIDPDDDAGAVVITGSHGALLGGKADAAIPHGLLAVTFNDAGVGKDGAGIRRLALLDSYPTIAATIAAGTARIGDARSAWDDGVVSHVNETARATGGAPGMTLRAFVERVIETADK